MGAHVQWWQRATAFATRHATYGSTFHLVRSTFPLKVPRLLSLQIQDPDGVLIGPEDPETSTALLGVEGIHDGVEPFDGVHGQKPPA